MLGVSGEVLRLGDKAIAVALAKPVRTTMSAIEVRIGCESRCSGNGPRASRWRRFTRC